MDAFHKMEMDENEIADLFAERSETACVTVQEPAPMSTKRKRPLHATSTGDLSGQPKVKRAAESAVSAAIGESAPMSDPLNALNGVTASTVDDSEPLKEHTVLGGTEKTSTENEVEKTDPYLGPVVDEGKRPMINSCFGPTDPQVRTSNQMNS